MEVGNVSFVAELDLTKAQSQVEAFRKQLQGMKFDIPVSAVGSFEKSFGKLNNKTIKPKVDHSELESLNRHLDVKLNHYKQLQKHFNSNPLKVKFVESLVREKSVSSVSNKKTIPIETVGETSDESFMSQILNVLVSFVNEYKKGIQSFNVGFQSISKQVEKHSSENSANLKSVQKASKTSVAKNIFSTFIGQSFANFSSGFVDGVRENIEKEIGLTTKQLGGLLTELTNIFGNLGKDIGTNLLSDEIKSFVSFFKNNIQEIVGATKGVGVMIADSYEPLNKFIQQIDKLNQNIDRQKKVNKSKNIIDTTNQEKIDQEAINQSNFKEFDELSKKIKSLVEIIATSNQNLSTLQVRAPQLQQQKDELESNYDIEELTKKDQKRAKVSRLLTNQVFLREDKKAQIENNRQSDIFNILNADTSTIDSLKEQKQLIIKQTQDALEGLSETSPEAMNIRLDAGTKIKELTNKIKQVKANIDQKSNLTQLIIQRGELIRKIQNELKQVEPNSQEYEEIKIQGGQKVRELTNQIREARSPLKEQVQKVNFQATSQITKLDNEIAQISKTKDSKLKEETEPLREWASVTSELGDTLNAINSFRQTIELATKEIETMKQKQHEINVDASYVQKNVSAYSEFPRTYQIALQEALDGEEIDKEMIPSLTIGTFPKESTRAAYTEGTNAVNLREDLYAKVVLGAELDEEEFGLIIHEIVHGIDSNMQKVGKERRPQRKIARPETPEEEAHMQKFRIAYAQRGVKIRQDDPVIQNELEDEYNAELNAFRKRKKAVMRQKKESIITSHREQIDPAESTAIAQQGQALYGKLQSYKKYAQELELPDIADKIQQMQDELKSSTQNIASTYTELTNIVGDLSIETDTSKIEKLVQSYEELSQSHPERVAQAIDTVKELIVLAEKMSSGLAGEIKQEYQNKQTRELQGQQLDEQSNILATETETLTKLDNANPLITNAENLQQKINTAKKITSKQILPNDIFIDLKEKTEDLIDKIIKETTSLQSTLDLKENNTIADPWEDSSLQSDVTEQKDLQQKVKEIDSNELDNIQSKASTKLTKQDFTNLTTALAQLKDSIDQLSINLTANIPDKTGTTSLNVNDDVLTPELITEESSALALTTEEKGGGLSTYQQASSALGTVVDGLQTFGHTLQNITAGTMKVISPIYRTLQTLEDGVSLLIPYFGLAKAGLQTVGKIGLGYMAMQYVPGGQMLLEGAGSLGGNLALSGASGITTAIAEGASAIPFVGPSLAAAGTGAVTALAEAIGVGGASLLALGGAGQVLTNVAGKTFDTVNPEHLTGYGWNILPMGEEQGQSLPSQKKKGLLGQAKNALQSAGETIANQVKPPSEVKAELLPSPKENLSSLLALPSNVSKQKDIAKQLDNMLTADGIKKLIQMSNTTLGTNIKIGNKNQNLKAISDSIQSEDILKLAQGQMTDMQGNKLILPNASESGRTKYRKKGSEITDSLPNVGNFELTEKYLKNSITDFAKTLHQLTANFENTKVEDLYFAIDDFINTLKNFEIQHGLTKGQSRKIQGIKSVAQNLKSNVQNLSTYQPVELGDLKQSGKYYIEGIEEGIRIALPELVKVVKDAGKQIDNAMKMALDERSPSKKGEEKGRWYIEGIIKGVQKAFPQLKNTIKESENIVDNSNKKGKKQLKQRKPVVIPEKTIEDFSLDPVTAKESVIEIMTISMQSLKQDVTDLVSRKDALLKQNYNSEDEELNNANDKLIAKINEEIKAKQQGIQLYGRQIKVEKQQLAELKSEKAKSISTSTSIPEVKNTIDLIDSIYESIEALDMSEINQVLDEQIANPVEEAVSNLENSLDFDLDFDIPNNIPDIEDVVNDVVEQIENANKFIENVSKQIAKNNVTSDILILPNQKPVNPKDLILPNQKPVNPKDLILPNQKPVNPKNLILPNQKPVNPKKIEDTNNVDLDFEISNNVPDIEDVVNDVVEQINNVNDAIKNLNLGFNVPDDITSDLWENKKNTQLELDLNISSNIVDNTKKVVEQIEEIQEKIEEVNGTQLKIDFESLPTNSNLPTSPNQPPQPTQSANTQTQQPIECPACWSPNIPTAQNCSICGFPLTDSAKKKTKKKVKTQQTKQQKTQPQNDNSNQSKSNKNNDFNFDFDFDFPSNIPDIDSFKTLEDLMKEINDSLEMEQLDEVVNNTMQESQNIINSRYNRVYTDLELFLEEIKETRKEIEEEIAKANEIAGIEPPIKGEEVKAEIDQMLDGIANNPMFKTIESRFTNLKNGALRFLGTAFLFETFNGIFSKITDGAFDAALQVENLQRALSFSTGENGVIQLEKVKKEAQELGVNFVQAAEGLRQFSASTMGTSLNENAGQLVSQFQKSFAAFGLNGEQQEGAFLALSQMASKGTVSMEELRQQLAERLPGALSAAARAMGMTLPEFNKLVESGQVLAEDLLPAMASQLEIETSLGLVTSAKSTQAELTRLENNIFNIQAGVGQMQLTLAKIGLPILNKVLEVLVNHVDTLAIALAVTSAVSLTAFVATLIKALGALGLLKLAISGATVALKAMWVAFLPMLPYVAIGVALTAGFKMLHSYVTAGSKELKQYKKQLEDLKNISDELQNNKNNQNKNSTVGKLDRDFSIQGIIKSGNDGYGLDGYFQGTKSFTEGIKEEWDEMWDFISQRGTKKAREFIVNVENIGASNQSALDIYQNALSNNTQVDLGDGVTVTANYSEETVSEVQKRLADLRAEQANYKFQIAAVADQGDEELIKTLTERKAKVEEEIQRVMSEPFVDLVTIQQGIEAQKAVIDSVNQQITDLMANRNKYSEDNFNSRLNTYNTLLSESESRLKDLEKAEQKANEARKEANDLYTKQIQSLRILQRELANIDYRTNIEGIDGQINATLRRANGETNEYQFDQEMRQARSVEVNTKLNLSTEEYNKFESDLTNKLGKLDTNLKKQLGDYLGVGDLDKAIFEKQISPEAFAQLSGDLVPQEIKDAIEQSKGSENGLKAVTVLAQEYLTTWQNIKQQQLESANVLKEEADAVKQRKGDIRDFLRQLEDLDLQIADYFRQRQIGLENFRTQYEDIAIQNQKQSRDLVEQYQDLGRSLNSQIVQAKNELERTTREVQRQTLLNKGRESLQFGADGLFSNFLNLLDELIASEDELALQGLSLEEQRLQKEEEVLNIARQIRGLSEQRLDMERQRIVQLRDLMNAQVDWIIQQKSSWTAITRQVEDMERQAKEMGIAFTGIAESLDGINGSYVEIHNAIADMAEKIKASANNLEVSGGGNNSSGNGNVTTSSAIGDSLTIPNMANDKPIIVVTKSGEKTKQGLDILKFELVKDGKVIDSFTNGVTGVTSTQTAAGTSKANVGGSMTPLPDGMWSINTSNAKSVTNQDLSNYDPNSIPSGAVGPAWIALEPQFKTGRSGIGFHLENITAGTAGCIAFTDPAMIKKIADWTMKGASNLFVDLNADQVKRIKAQTPTVNTSNNQVTQTGKPRNRKFTFDDGPDPQYTNQILDELKRNGEKATFYVVGAMVKKYPEIVRRIYQEGHQIGVHSYSHRDLTKLSDKDVALELSATMAEIENALKPLGVAYKPTLFRAPYGETNSRVNAQARKLGLTNSQGWDVDTNDWRQGTTKANVQNSINNAKPNQVILLHDGRDAGLRIAEDPILQQFIKEKFPNFVPQKQNPNIKVNPTRNATIEGFKQTRTQQKTQPQQSTTTTNKSSTTSNANNKLENLRQQYGQEAIIYRNSTGQVVTSGNVQQAQSVASLNKILIASLVSSRFGNAEVNKPIAIDQRYIYQDGKNKEDISKLITSSANGQSFTTLGRLVKLMIEDSSNTAANLLIKALGGNTQATKLARQRWGNNQIELGYYGPTTRANVPNGNAYGIKASPMSIYSAFVDLLANNNRVKEIANKALEDGDGGRLKDKSLKNKTGNTSKVLGNIGQYSGGEVIFILDNQGEGNKNSEKNRQNSINLIDQLRKGNIQSSIPTNNTTALNFALPKEINVAVNLDVVSDIEGILGFTPQNPLKIPLTLDIPSNQLMALNQSDIDQIRGETDIAKLLQWEAQQLGVNARDLAAIQSYESGHSFSQNKWDPTRQWLGRIQFDANNRKKYGVYEGMSQWEHSIAIVKYLKDRGIKEGATLKEIYKAINPGYQDDLNKHLTNQGHWAKADEVLGGASIPSVTSTPSSTSLVSIPKIERPDLSSALNTLNGITGKAPTIFSYGTSPMPVTLTNPQPLASAIGNVMGEIRINSDTINPIIDALSQNKAVSPEQMENLLFFRDTNDYQGAEEYLKSQNINLANVKDNIQQKLVEQYEANKQKVRLENEKKAVEFARQQLQTIRSLIESANNLNRQYIEFSANAKGFLTYQEESILATIETEEKIKALQNQIRDAKEEFAKMLDFKNLENGLAKLNEAIKEYQLRNDNPEMLAFLIKTREELESGSITLTEYQEKIKGYENNLESLGETQRKTNDRVNEFNRLIKIQQDRIDAIKPLVDIFQNIDMTVAKSLGRELAKAEASVQFDQAKKGLEDRQRVINESLSQEGLTDEQKERLKQELINVQKELGQMTGQMKLEFELKAQLEFDHQKATEQIQAIMESSRKVAERAEKDNPFDTQYSRMAKEAEIVLEYNNQLMDIEKQRKYYQNDPDKLDELDKLKAKIEEFKKVDLSRIEQEINVFARAIKEPLNNAFKGLFSDFIKGTKTIKDIFLDFANSVADFFADLAAEMTTQWVMDKLFPPKDEKDKDKPESVPRELMNGLWDKYSSSGKNNNNGITYSTLPLPKGLDFPQLQSMSQGVSQSLFPNIDSFTNENNNEYLFNTATSIGTFNMNVPSQTGQGGWGNIFSGVLQGLIGGVSSGFGLMADTADLFGKASSFVPSTNFLDTASGSYSFGSTPLFSDGGLVKDNIKSFSTGGIVESASLGLSVLKAIKKEGRDAVPIVAHLNERLISSKNGDTKILEKIEKDGVWDEYKRNRFNPEVKAFNAGGVVGNGIRNFTRNYNNQSSNTNQTTVINVSTPDALSFRKSRSQIAQEEKLAQNRMKRFS